MIVFRDQDISNEDQVRFCRYFGDLEDVRTGKFANEEMRHTMMITNVTDTGFQTALENGDMWFHSDQCYYEFPCRASTLYAIEIPRWAAIRCSQIAMPHGKRYLPACGKNSMV